MDRGISHCCLLLDELIKSLTSLTIITFCTNLLSFCKEKRIQMADFTELTIVSQTTFSLTMEEKEIGGAVADEDLEEHLARVTIDNGHHESPEENGHRNFPWDLPQNRRIMANGGFIAQAEPESPGGQVEEQASVMSAVNELQGNGSHPLDSPAITVCDSPNEVSPSSLTPASSQESVRAFFPGGEGTEELLQRNGNGTSGDSSLDGSILSKVKFFSSLGGTKSDVRSPTKPIIKPYRKDFLGSAAKPELGGAGDILDAKPRHRSSSVPHAAVPQGFYSLRYCMDHPRRGTAVIINNREFLMKDTPYRKGSDNDAVTLHKTLLKLGFKVDAWTDLTAQSMRDAMAFYAKMDHSDADCFFLSIFSHGEDGVIYGTDSKVTLGELTAPFRGDRCTTLAAKPKIFVIQACRGDQLDSGVDLVEADAAGDGSVYRIPAESDFLYAFSTPSGYFSWRNTELGSWFIQSLCRTLSEHADHPDMDILRLLTRVNYEVAISNESNVPHDTKWHRKKQIPSVVSMLTKDLFFTPKSGHH